MAYFLMEVKKKLDKLKREEVQKQMKINSNENENSKTTTNGTSNKIN